MCMTLQKLLSLEKISEETSLTGLTSICFCSGEGTLRVAFISHTERHEIRSKTLPHITKCGAPQKTFYMSSVIEQTLWLVVSIHQSVSHLPSDFILPKPSSLCTFCVVEKTSKNLI